jgi:phage gpG-like protein
MHWKVAVQKLEQLKADLPKLVGNEMVNYALDNMNAESFDGKKWKKRKPGAPRNEGRKLLVDTGAGRRSIKVQRADQDRVDLTANEYMQAHNEGAKISKTVQVRSHARKRKGRSETVGSHSRKMNTQLPERKFTGKSPVQTTRINKMIANKIVKALT